MFKPRKLQKKVIDYNGGWMGVAAVPGSGKTQTLSFLAAKLITEGYIRDNQEVLIVTLVNSAVENFSSRVSGLLESSGLIPGLGYRVRTLHGLAHDIVRERPDLAGLSNHFEIIDEKEADRILNSAAQAWLQANPDFQLDFTKPDIELSSNNKARQAWQKLAVDIAGSFVRQAKDLQSSPAAIQERLNALSSPPTLLTMGCNIYADYQRALNYRSAVDFDDLIRLALQVIKSDPEYLSRLQDRWPYILEDEAQDSSNNQERILRLLSAKNRNWVRVGDPNQAIFETFTTANPRFLIDFLQEAGVKEAKLLNSGRSSPSIIKLANHLVSWTRSEHPVPELQNGLFNAQILETEPDDPQPNPPDNPNSVYLSRDKFSADREIKVIVASLKRWLDVPENKIKTVAVLVPRNYRGAQIVDELKKNGLAFIELLQSSAATRETANILSSILHALSDPDSQKKLSSVYTLMRKEEADHKTISTTASLLMNCPRLEDYFAPRLGRDWIQELEEQGAEQDVLDELSWLRKYFQRWQAATLLPIDQLLLTISQDLFSQPADLATAHKLALLLERLAASHLDWGLPHFSDEVTSIAKNQRKFSGFSDEDTGFDPEQHKGKVVVATIHKSKGLEWDRVYILSANNYNFPSAQPNDKYIGEKWFIREEMNLQAETISKLNQLLSTDLAGLNLAYGPATISSRLDYAAERLRLLYVGITRARSELSITWNTGRSKNQLPALPLVELQTFWEMEKNDPAS